METALGYAGKTLKSNIVKTNRAGDNQRFNQRTSSFIGGFGLPTAGLVAAGDFWSQSITSNWAELVDEPTSAVALPSASWSTVPSWPTPAPPEIIEIQKPAQTTTNPNTIWVGGFFNDTVEEEEIREFFGPIKDHIVKVKMMYDKATGKQKAFCFVEFDDPNLVDDAINNYAGRVLRNHIIKINKAGLRDRGASISVINPYPSVPIADYSGPTGLGAIAEESLAAAVYVDSQDLAPLNHDVPEPSVSQSKSWNLNAYFDPPSLLYAGSMEEMHEQSGQQFVDASTIDVENKVFLFTLCAFFTLSRMLNRLYIQCGLVGSKMRPSMRKNCGSFSGHRFRRR